MPDCPHRARFDCDLGRRDERQSNRPSEGRLYRLALLNYTDAPFLLQLCCRLSCWLHQGTPPSFISLACRLCQCTWYFGGSAGFLRPALLQHFQDIFSQSARADSFACTCTLPFRAFSATASLPRKFVQRVSRSSPLRVKYDTLRLQHPLLPLHTRGQCACGTGKAAQRQV